ncbi:MAG: O-antigen ligase family protein [Methylocella sp.]
MHNISADQAVFFFIIFIVFFDKRYNYYFVLFALAILLLTSTHLVSSYTTISCLSLTLIFCVRSTALSRVIVPWRITVIVAIVCLALTSLFASYVNLKDSRVSEGNNGQARETLAQHAFSVFMDFPLIGTPLGRGIVPLEAVEELGWEQYLDPEIAKDMAAAGEESSASLGYDVYSLSFHNGFLYLLTRFGVLSLFLIYFLVRYVPRKGPLPIVIFTVVVLLSISANVVIESLRSGPGVALVLGALFSFGELSSWPAPMG